MKKLNVFAVATVFAVGVSIAAVENSPAVAADADAPAELQYSDGRLTIGIDDSVASDPEKAARLKEYQVPNELGKYIGIYLKKLKLRDSVLVKVNITNFRLRATGNVAFTGMFSGADHIDGTVVFEEDGKEIKHAVIESEGLGGGKGEDRIEVMAKSFGKDVYKEARALM